MTNLAGSSREPSSFKSSANCRAPATADRLPPGRGLGRFSAQSAPPDGEAGFLPAIKSDTRRMAVMAVGLHAHSRELRTVQHAACMHLLSVGTPIKSP